MPEVNLKNIKMKKYIITIIVLLLSANTCLAGNSVENQINKYRKSIGLKELKIDRSMERTALFKNNDMIKWDYFAHMNPFGEKLGSIFYRYDLDWQYGGEILSDNYSEKEVLKAWLNSKAHKAIIINTVFSGFGCSTKSTFITCHFVAY